MNIADLLKDPNKAKEVLREAIYDENKELAEILIPIVQDPELTHDYAYHIVKGKIKDEWEEIIARDTKASYYYAANVLESPFPKGEDAISKSAEYSYYYAKILNDRFIKGEDTIAKSTFYSFYYAKDVLKGPFPKGEDAISKSAEYSYLYARNILKDRFIKGEKAIIKKRNYLKDYIEFLKQIGKLDDFLKDHPKVKV